MSTKSGHFDLWLFRSEASHSPYSLKFKVHSGRGLLRIWRAAGELSQPATGAGEIRDLDQQELQQSRFVHVDGTRNEYSFTDDFSALSGTLPEETWIKLLAGDDMRLRIPDLPAEIILRRRSEPWSPNTDPAENPILPTQRPRLTDHGKRQTAADRIVDLEAQLAASRGQNTKLKQRIVELEAQLESLGGEPTPLVLD